jgi:hypothetical protein
MSIPKGGKSVKDRGILINRIITELSDESIIIFSDISKSKKEFCELIGIQYSTNNFKKIQNRLEVLGLLNILSKFKNKRKEIIKSDIIDKINNVPNDEFVNFYNEASSILELCGLLGLNGKNKIIYYLVKDKVQSMNLNVTKFKVRTYNIYKLLYLGCL